MTTQIDKLIETLTGLGWKPAKWEAHGKVRVYCNVNMGKNFRKGGKCYFDYESPEDAAVEFDNTLPVIFGAAFKVWHPKATLRTWAFNELKAKFLQHCNDNNITYKYQ